jgi:hypothetical protein
MQARLNELAKERSSSAVKHCRIFLCSICTEAVGQDYLRKNPARLLRDEGKCERRPITSTIGLYTREFTVRLERTFLNRSTCRTMAHNAATTKPIGRGSKGASWKRRFVTKNSRKPNRPSAASFQTPPIGSLRKKDASTPASAPAAIASSPQTSKKKIVKPGGTG